MTRVAYVDLVSGAAGDMLMAAAVHAGRRCGVDVERPVREAVGGLGLRCSVRFEEASRAGLACLTAKVIVPSESLTPDRLREAIDRAPAGDAARAAAVAALEALVAAEARVHGVDPEHVHLHELGSPDTAADLIGVSVALQALGVTSLAASPIPAPRGTIASEHGQLPLPAPVTLEVLQGAPMYGVDEQTELLTPTAAALLVAHGARFGPMPAMTLEATGVGGGARDPAHRPNVCRMMIGTPVEQPGPDAAPAMSSVPEGVSVTRDVLLEANIDDQTPETLAYALETLMSAGAHDAWLTPIVMKKSRTAVQLSVLCDPAHEGAMLDIVFRHTTTLGARRREVAKWVLGREVVHVPVRGVNIRVKVGRIGAEAVTVSPEYEDCLTVATKSGMALLDVYAEASAKARRTLGT